MTIHELSHTNAKQFFLKQESYCQDKLLPKYYNFNELLKKLSNKNINLSNKNLQDAKQCDDVNYTFFHNKDGQFAWRPLQLINPAIYVFLVHQITTKDNWQYIIERFKKFQENPKIKCCSIPIISKDEKKSDKEETVINWWSSIEQQSLELALDWDCFLNTDITDCYGSIYTHTITWALHDKNVAKDIVSGKKPRPSIYIGNDIDSIIQSMQYAQTNGIPQGSVLMDFIAEMVLGYADMLLTEKINDLKIENYQILRYRDDYRIFTNTEEEAKKIAKLLTEVLIDLNFRLNSQKTFISNNIIKDSIKPDKLYWINAKKGEKTLQKTILLIHSLAEKHPNSGSLMKALSDFLKRIYKKETLGNENIKTIISIVVDIAYKNPKTYSVSTGILTKLLSSLEADEVVSTISSIENKFNKIPNVGHLMIWLQRLTLKINYEKEYKESLCKKVIDKNITIWNIDWLNDEIKTIIKDTPIIDEEYINNMSPIMEPNEVQLFENNY